MTTASAAAAPSTCYQVICDGMKDAGKLGEGREPTGEQLAENMRRLNKYVNYLQTQGAILWVQEDVALKAPVLQAGKNAYTFGPLGDVTSISRPRRIIDSGYFLEPNSLSKRPLSMISRNEFNTLSTTVQQGTITSYYVDKQLQVPSTPGLSMVVNLWMTPNAQAALGEVHLVVDGQIPNFSNLTDTMAFPPEWALCLEWGLADQICTGMPQEVVDRCASKSLSYEAGLLNWDVEDASTTFQPDPRGGYSGKRVGRY